jgi:hypothetical protein
MPWVQSPAPQKTKPKNLWRESEAFPMIATVKSVLMSSYFPSYSLIINVEQ